MADGTANRDNRTEHHPPPKASYASLYNKQQLATLCVARFAEPLAATSIQSYMFYQLRFFDPSASNATISTQAGILTGAKTAAQVCTGILWGRVADADSVGRKPVLMTGLLSAGLACVGYGLSRSFAAAIAWQMVGGAFNSNISMVRCVVAETYPEKRYRARALMLLPLCANVGLLLGPLLGGLLSAQPGLEGNRAVTGAYPYLLPNLCIAALYFISAVGVFFGVRETLATFNQQENATRSCLTWLRKVTGRANVRDYSYHRVDAESPSEAATFLAPESPTTQEQATNPDPSSAVIPTTKPSWRRILTFNVFCTMLSHFIISGHLGTFNILWTVFLSTPTSMHRPLPPSPLKFTGGLGMQPRSVGTIMSALGALIVFLQLVIYPRLSDHFGTIRIWSVALFAFPLAYFLAPFPALFASSGEVLGEQGGGFRAQWLAVAGVLFLHGIGRTGVTPATTMLINDCSPHPGVRATIHSLATVLGNLSRSIFPVAAMVIFGVGLEMQVVGLAFWCLTGLALLSCLASRFVKDTSGDEGTGGYRHSA